MKFFELTIVVDTNDADYLTSVTKISEEDLEKLKPLIAAIAAVAPNKRYASSHNYSCGEYNDSKDHGPNKYPQFDEDLHDMLLDHCPYGEHGFHTINSIHVTPFVEKTKLL